MHEHTDTRTCTVHAFYTLNYIILLVGYHNQYFEICLVFEKS